MCSKYFDPSEDTESYAAEKSGDAHKSSKYFDPSEDTERASASFCGMRVSSSKYFDPSEDTESKEKVPSMHVYIEEVPNTSIRPRILKDTPDQVLHNLSAVFQILRSVRGY